MSKHKQQFIEIPDQIHIQKFIEIPDQIPYRKISYFNILSVRISNDQFEIKLERKCQGWQIEKEYIIVRKINDFKWLLKQLQIESPWLIILPSLMESNWSIMDVISTVNTVKANLKKWSNQCYQRRIVHRFLKIMNQISLKNVYQMPGFKDSSLFTFLDKSFQLYKLQKYQKINVIKQPVPTNNKLSQLAHSIGKGSIKLLGMLNIIKQNQSHKYLQLQTVKLQQLKKQLQILSTQQQKLQKSLEQLSQNFLNQQKHIKNKQQKIYELELKLNDLLRIVIQIYNEAIQILHRFKQYEQKNDDKINIKQSIIQYQKFISNQIVEIQAEINRLLKDMYKEFYEEPVKIKITNLYPCRT